MKTKHSIRKVLLIAGVTAGIFIAARFAVPSTRMAVFAAGQYIQEFITLK